MATDKPRFSVTFDDDQLSEIENFRHKNKISTRSKAVTKLVEIGLTSLLKDNPDLSTKAKSPSLSTEAEKIARKYDSLPNTGKRLVRVVIDELQRDGSSQELPHPPTRIIPLLGNSFAAGIGEPDFGNALEDYEVPYDTKADFAVRVNGDSMEPWLPDGSIQFCTKGTPKDGDVAVLLVDGAFYIKQICIDVYDNLYLFSLNRARKDADKTVWASAESRVQCFGTVIMKKRVPLPLD